MSFWAGVAQYVKEENQREHEKELFQERVLQKRKDSLVNGLLERRAAEAERTQEIAAMIEKGEKIFNGDEDVVAALYASGQLPDLIGLYEKRFESEGGLDPSYFGRAAAVVREQMGDDIVGFGERLSAALASDAQSYNEFMAVAASGNISELPTETASAVTEFRTTNDVPSFGIPGTGQSGDRGSGDYSSAQKAVATAVGPLLGFNVSNNQETGELVINFNTDSDFITEDQAQMALNAATRVFYNRGDLNEDQALQYIEDTIAQGKTGGQSWDGIKGILDETASNLRGATNPADVLFSPTVVQPTSPVPQPELTFGNTVVPTTEVQPSTTEEPVQPVETPTTPSQTGPADTEYEAMETLGSGTEEEPGSTPNPFSVGEIFDDIFGR